MREISLTEREGKKTSQNETPPKMVCLEKVYTPLTLSSEKSNTRFLESKRGNVVQGQA